MLQSHEKKRLLDTRESSLRLEDRVPSIILNILAGAPIYPYFAHSKTDKDEHKNKYNSINEFRNAANAIVAQNTNIGIAFNRQLNTISRQYLNQSKNHISAANRLEPAPGKASYLSRLGFPSDLHELLNLEREKREDTYGTDRDIAAATLVLSNNTGTHQNLLETLRYVHKNDENGKSELLSETQVKKLHKEIITTLVYSHNKIVLDESKNFFEDRDCNFLLSPDYESTENNPPNRHYFGHPDSVLKNIICSHVPTAEYYDGLNGKGIIPGADSEMIKALNNDDIYSNLLKKNIVSHDYRHWHRRKFHKLKFDEDGYIKELIQSLAAPRVTMIQLGDGYSFYNGNDNKEHSCCIIYVELPNFKLLQTGTQNKDLHHISNMYWNMVYHAWKLKTVSVMKWQQKSCDDDDNENIPVRDHFFTKIGWKEDLLVKQLDQYLRDKDLLNNYEVKGVRQLNDKIIKCSKDDLLKNVQLPDHIERNEIRNSELEKIDLRELNRWEIQKLRDEKKKGKTELLPPIAFIGMGIGTNEDINKDIDDPNSKLDEMINVGEMELDGIPEYITNIQSPARQLQEKEYEHYVLQHLKADISRKKTVPNLARPVGTQLRLVLDNQVLRHEYEDDVQYDPVTKQFISDKTQYKGFRPDAHPFLHGGVLIRHKPFDEGGNTYHSYNNVQYQTYEDFKSRTFIKYFPGFSVVNKTYDETLEVLNDRIHDSLSREDRAKYSAIYDPHIDHVPAGTKWKFYIADAILNSKLWDSHGLQFLKAAQLKYIDRDDERLFYLNECYLPPELMLKSLVETEMDMELSKDLDPSSVLFKNFPMEIHSPDSRLMGSFSHHINRDANLLYDNFYKLIYKPYLETYLLNKFDLESFKNSLGENTDYHGGVAYMSSRLAEKPELWYKVKQLTEENVESKDNNFYATKASIATTPPVRSPEYPFLQYANMLGIVSRRATLPANGYIEDHVHGVSLWGDQIFRSPGLTRMYSILNPHEMSRRIKKSENEIEELINGGKVNRDIRNSYFKYLKAPEI